MGNKLTKTILITRPFEDSIDLSKELQAMDFQIIIDPMIMIEIKIDQIQHIPTILDDSLQLIVISSANGLIALATLYPDRNIKIITVGESSYGKGLALGYKNIQMANPEYGGDVNGLLRAIEEDFSPNNGKIIHISSSIQAGNLVQTLQENSFNAQNLCLYDAQEMSYVSKKLKAGLTNRQIDLAPFYSPRTLKIFLKLLEQENLSQYLSNITCLCLSSNIAKIAASANFENVIISKKPTRHDMLELIRHYC